MVPNPAFDSPHRESHRVQTQQLLCSDPDHASNRSETTAVPRFQSCDAIKEIPACRPPLEQHQACESSTSVDTERSSREFARTSSGPTTGRFFFSVLYLLSFLPSMASCINAYELANWAVYPDTFTLVSTTTQDISPGHGSALYVVCRHYTYSNHWRITFYGRDGQYSRINPSYGPTGYNFLCTSKGDLTVFGGIQIDSYQVRTQLDPLSRTFSLSLLNSRVYHPNSACNSGQTVGSVNDTNSNYVYVAMESKRLTRMDISGFSVDTLCNVLSPCNLNDMWYFRSIEDYTVDLLVLSDNRYINYIMKSTLNQLYTYDFYWDQSQYISYVLTDPILPVHHVATESAWIMQINKCYDSTVKYGCFTRRNYYTSFDRNWHSLTLFQPFNLLMATSNHGASPRLHFLRAHDYANFGYYIPSYFSTFYYKPLYAGYINMTDPSIKYARHFFAVPTLSGGYVYLSAFRVDIHTCSVYDLTTGKCATCPPEFLVAAKWNSNQTICDPVNSAPPGYGTHPTSPAFFTKCLANNCEICPDINWCFKCASGYYMQLYSSGWNMAARCHLDSSTFPASWGPANSGGGVQPFLRYCSTSYCAECPVIYSTCTKCIRNYGLDSTTNTCVLLSSLGISSGKGLNWATNLIDTCTEPSCVSCRQNHTYCDYCYGDNQRVTYRGKCIYSYELPLGQGLTYITSPTQAYVAGNCTEVSSTRNCYNCSSDSTKCQECVKNTTISYTGYEFLYQTVLNTAFQCVFPYNLPNGIGANWATYETSPCSDTNCLNCALDYTKCRVCNSALTPTPYLYNNACIPLSSAPAGFGGYSGNYSLLACEKAYCLTCQNDFKVCQTCDTTLATPRYQYGGYCLTAFELPAFFGGNMATGMSTACADTNCWYCRQDYQTCTLCKSSYYMHSGVCTLASALPDGFGADTTYNVSQPCQDTNCLRCQSNYISGCSACKPATNPQTYFLSASCLIASKLPDGKGGNNATYIATTCSDTANGCTKCQVDYTVCTACTGSKYLYSGACLSSASLPNGYGAGPNNLAYPCTDTACQNCKSDYTVCLSCQNTSPYYYYHSPNQSCLLVSQIPTGYGAKNVSGYGQTALCSASSCTSCQADYSVCGFCASNNPPLWVYSSTCTLETNLPVGYGGNAATGAAVPCSDANCQDCKANYQVCVTCKTLTPAVYLHNLTGVCYLPANIPDGYGPNLVTKLTTPCSVTNCSNCKTVYTTCAACNSTGAFPNYLVGGLCYLEYNLPYGYGSNNTTYAGDPCSSNLCQNCSRNPLDCQQCKIQSPDLFLHNNGTYNVCLTSSQMPAGFGPETSSYTTRTCSVSGCQVCADNFAVCTSCNASITPALYFYEGSCRRASQLPDPYGANPSTRVATVCLSSRCVSCKTNYRYCDACNRVNPETFRVAATGICVTKAEIPAGLGPDLTTYEVRSCKDTRCKVCNDNYLQCKTCITTQGQLYTANYTCLKIDEVKAGYGVDNSTYTVKECESLGCKNCLYNYSKCVECVDPPANPTTSNPKYYMIEDACNTCSASPLFVIDYTCRRLCSDNSCKITLRSSRFIKQKKQLKCQFSHSVYLNSSAPIKLRIDAPANNVVRDLKPQEYDISINNDVMLITLSIAESEAGGTIFLDRANSEENPIRGVGNDLAFFDYPIAWEGIYLLTSNTQKTLTNAAGASSTTTASAKAIAQLLIITKSSNIAKIPDMMVSNMIYLQLMNGETYLYPALVFGFFANSYLPFIDLSNPFDPDLRDAACLMPPKFFEQEMDCGILPNYGIDVLILYGTLAINIVLSLVHYTLYGAKLKLYKIHKDKVNAEKMEKSIGYKISSFVNESYGLKMSLVKLDGTVVEVLFYSALTITSQPISTLKYGYSAMVAFSLIGYYLWSLYWYVRLIIYITPGLEKVRKLEEERKKTSGSRFKPKELGNYVDFTRVKYGLVGYQIEDYRADLPQAFYYAPLVWFLRCVFINMFLIGGTNMKSGQYFMYMIIEAGYLYYLVKSKVKAAMFENYLSYFNEGAQIFYVFLQTISYYSDDVDFKQKQIGLIQAIVLGAVMAINIGYTFVIFFWQVLIQPIVRRCKKQKPEEMKDRLKEDDLTGKVEGKDPEEAKNLVAPKFSISTFRHVLKKNFDLKNNLKAGNDLQAKQDEKELNADESHPMKPSTEPPSKLKHSASLLRKPRLLMKPKQGGEPELKL